MSDDNNLSNNLNDMMDDAKENAKKAADKVNKKASEFAEEAKEAAKEFTESAKETFNTASGENKKVLSGILGILFGWLGIHKFILGYTKEGVILLIFGVLGFLTCGITSGISWIIGFIEGLIYLTKSDEDFYNTYQAGYKPWF